MLNSANSVIKQGLKLSDVTLVIENYFAAPENVSAAAQ